ncbi:helix-turn-helix domain-containing protein [Aphanothece sacrum]|uniref:XRE family transcriptional regulator n=1 Tax=Aphanothece sacrum FPU1 TaxID=1920663 RepID=A0A401IMI9_APHSA|nr:helix-turn-helix transcriptional regulator [Aphanothece sacrum]GBF82456.1 XRE family transcriptional regulator [Aphanothece sacrum FPU1]GBF84389.1 XRE family transcriptional regulator [Aphanothece sacrum FPU3]
MNQDIDFYPSSGNIFEDLGFENADEMLAKAELIRQITIIIQQRKLTDEEVATLLKIETSQVVELVKGKLLKFSTDNLIRFLTALGKDVEIVVKNTPSVSGKVTVTNT